VTTYRSGALTFQGDDSDVEFNADVSYAGTWRSINDYINYRVAAEGFGTTQQTFRRIELNSSFYAGTYDVNRVPDSTKRSLAVFIKGASFEDLAAARDDLLNWFTQDDFLIRITRDETLEYWQCDCADYSLDESHVFMHNKMCKVTFTITVAPFVNTDVLY
jgi:hypothetical protein